MLIRYSVGNFKSIRDKVELSMEAVGISELKETLITGRDRETYLPLAAIYGPNGGGKSNVLESLFSLKNRLVWTIISSLNNEQIEKQIRTIMTPFLFNAENKNKPIIFEVVFANVLGEYKYEIYFEGDVVSKERLEIRKYKTNKTSLLFEKTNDEIKLGEEFKSFRIPASISKGLPILSFVGYSYKEHEIVKDVVDWWINRITIENYANVFTETQILDDSDVKVKTRVLQFLSEVDINIVDYVVDKNGAKPIKIHTTHETNGYRSTIDFFDESSGTIKMFTLAPKIMQSLLNGTTLIVDEIDAKLHPLLLRHIIELYNSKESNKNGAQLIFTSHDMTTMTNELLRRDEIWFAAKGNSEDTQLYSLIEFKGEGEIEAETVRKDAKYSKQYLEGRYGADPYFQRIINWDELRNEQKAV